MSDQASVPATRRDGERPQNIPFILLAAVASFLSGALALRAVAAGGENWAIIGVVLIAGLLAVFATRWMNARFSPDHQVLRLFQDMQSRSSEVLILSDFQGARLCSNGQLSDALPELRDPCDAIIYRALESVRRVGFGTELLAGKNGERVSVSASRFSESHVIWRVGVDHNPSSRIVSPEQATGFIQLICDPNGKVRNSNALADAVLGRAPETASDLVVGEITNDGELHELAGDEPRTVRAVVLPRGNDQQEIILTPADMLETAGADLDQILDRMPVALARIEPNGKLIFANEPARGLLGEKAVAGIDLSDLIEGLGRSVQDRLEDVMRGRRHSRTEVARGVVNDREIFLQVTLTRIVINGEPALLVLLSDATELKTLEAQFVQSQKMQAVGQLAGGVAHDFNNLLTAINGHCDLLLLRHNRNDIGYSDLTQIQQNANRAASLVRQLLAFSRKQNLQPRVLDLKETLSDLTHLLNRLLGEKVTLNINHGRELHPVRVDKRQFEQVVMNLVVNARDAITDRGTVEILSSNRHLSSDLCRDRAVVPMGEYVVIEVTDSGTGIPEDKISQIFEPFFTTKPTGEGTGLGLSTAYGIIKQTGGFIFADSPEGKGACFSIYLPAHYKIDDDDEEDMNLPAKPATRDMTGTGVVLLVEDEAPVRSFAARALSLRGYSVLEAASAEEALEILDDEDLHVDIFVSDVIMPGMDGPTWVREALKTRPEVPVVFVSGYAEDAFKDGQQEIKGSIFLPKPFSLNELTEKVKDQMNRVSSAPH